MKCDSHIHIYDRAFLKPGAAQAFVENADVAAYRMVQAQLGTERVVIVTPRVYGTDNAVTVDAIRQLGIDHARGVAVLHPDVSDAELDALNRGGIRGIRFTLYSAKNAAVGFDMIEPLAERVAELGWHVQLHWTAEQIVEHEALLRRLPAKIVFDHRARLPLEVGVKHAAFDIVRRLADEGRAWIKLSGPYLDSSAGLDNRYADITPMARAWVQAVPERLVWGSDWPHVTETHKPDDAMLLDLLTEWTDDNATRERILVTNPAVLYGFAI
ncbi:MULTISPECIES: amidohydrolase family protein [unclassified Caballeronia]|uniref:amidohydrolase family protein n=1 Tax=unclassified Caballeronia TaxID=2646786 RepID=UPI0028635EF5|nr:MULTISPECIES: amidohydrolase family protein [unclassified Caballeronia]MDR5752591.1 amidohydrolase family protein [Caballeronia sp. LZ024]MDR5841651.1 amidohydrolase family protein [Caballeronia sp. LZ031]